MSYKSHREARMLMQNHIGRKLSRFDVVHHIDGDPSNNEISNLLLTTPEEHARIHRPAKGKKHKQPQWNKLSEETIKEILRLSDRGLNYSQIGRTLKISNFTARKYILKGGITNGSNSYK